MDYVSRILSDVVWRVIFQLLLLLQEDDIGVVLERTSSIRQQFPLPLRSWKAPINDPQLLGAGLLTLCSSVLANVSVGGSCTEKLLSHQVHLVEVHLHAAVFLDKVRPGCPIYLCLTSRF